MPDDTTGWGQRLVSPPQTGDPELQAGPRRNTAMDDDPSPESEWTPGEVPDRVPTVQCGRCDREWELEYELETLQAGNRAVEQFAMDHHRHTGHFPDGMTPWLVDCRQCPSGEEFLEQRAARRWAGTHARHTGHEVELAHGEDDFEIIGDSD